MGGGGSRKVPLCGIGVSVQFYWLPYMYSTKITLQLLCLIITFSNIVSTLCMLRLVIVKPHV